MKYVNLVFATEALVRALPEFLLCTFFHCAALRLGPTLEDQGCQLRSKPCLQDMNIYYSGKAHVDTISEQPLDTKAQRLAEAAARPEAQRR